MDTHLDEDEPHGFALATGSPAPMRQEFRLFWRALSAWRFPAELEAQYRAWFVRRYAAQLRLGIVAGVLVFFLTGVADPLFEPGVAARHLLIVRYGLMLPVALFLLLGVFSTWFYRYQQVFLVLTSLLGQLGLLLLGGEVPAAYHLVFDLGLAMALLYALVFLYLRLCWVLLLVLLAHVGIYVDLQPTWLGGSVSMAEVVVLEGLTLLGLFAAYGAAYQARNTFTLERIVLERQTSLARMRDRFREMSERDELTGLHNRRAFIQALEQEWGRARRYDYPVALAMIDVDYFKQYNDRYEHVKGDELLHRIAMTLQEMLRRPGDMAVRWGGDEFLLLWPGVSELEAEELAGHLLQRVHALAIEHLEAPLQRLSLSVGVAACRSQRDENLLLRHADAALYAAKMQGRNRVVAYRALEGQRSFDK